MSFFGILTIIVTLCTHTMSATSFASLVAGLMPIICVYSEAIRAISHAYTCICTAMIMKKGLHETFSVSAQSWCAGLPGGVECCVLTENVNGTVQ